MEKTNRQPNFNDLVKDQKAEVLDLTNYVYTTPNATWKSAFKGADLVLIHDSDKMLNNANVLDKACDNAPSGCLIVIYSDGGGFETFQEYKYNGRIIWNDVLVALFAIDALNDHPRAKIMYNTLCSNIVEETIKKYNGTPFMWRTGHSFLKKKNQEVKAAFIGELSGHFFFSKDFYNHDDGLYSTLRLLRYLSRTNQTLAQAVSSLSQYISSPEIKIGCSDDTKVELIAKIAEKLRLDYPQAQVINDERAGDGVRLNMPDSMFVVRYSQNGPYLTIKFEATTQKKYDKLKIDLNNLLHNYPEIDWSFGVNIESLK